jgi:aspartate-semialdehyde dehydrogenase
MRKIPVGILGATGIVGQQYIQLLQNHPWFEITWLAASERSAGKSYAEAVHHRWLLHIPIPEAIANVKVHSVEDASEAKKHCDLVFSALSGHEVEQIEENHAAAGLWVFSNASAHRKTSDVPILIPEINSHHLAIIPRQRQRRGWNTGCIVVKPNCSIQSYLIPLYALHKQFKIKRAIVTTFQAVSGAGHPGVASLDVMDNVIPYIPGEEEKSEWEPLKILGEIKGDAIEPLSSMVFAAHCNRVPVLDGHMACVSAEFEKKPALEEILHVWQNFRGAPQEQSLPSAPEQTIVYRHEHNRPQPRLDRNTHRGMAVTVGRLRSCPVFDVRFVGLSHNTVRGAAGGGILNAELFISSREH